MSDPLEAKEIWTLARLMPLDEGLAALQDWKIERIAAYWMEIDQAVQHVTAEAIRLWPSGPDNIAGLLEVVAVSKTALREAAEALGLPPSVLPFTDTDVTTTGETT